MIHHLLLGLYLKQQASPGAVEPVGSPGTPGKLSEAEIRYIYSICEDHMDDLCSPAYWHNIWQSVAVIGTLLEYFKVAGSAEGTRISKKDLCHLSAMFGIICLITSILANFANLVNLYIVVLI